jgi:hypothetical protein
LAACALLIAGLPGAACAALKLEVTHQPAPVIAGDAIDVTATVVNLGPGPADDVRIGVQNQGSGKLTAPAPGCTVFFDFFGQCELPDLAEGQSGSARFRLTGVPVGPASLYLTGQATQGSAPAVAWQAEVEPVTQLSLEVRADPATLTAGNATSLTGTVKNIGAGIAYGATLRFSLPFGLVPGTLPAGCAAGGLNVTCALGPLASQATAARTIPILPPEVGTYSVNALASWARDPTVSADTTIGVEAPSDPTAGQPPADAPGAPAVPAPRTVSIERVSVGLPGKGRCVRDRVLDVLLRGVPRSASVRIGSRRARTLAGVAARRPFTLRVPRGVRRFTVRISATYTDGSVFRATRTYRVCARKRR